jgi:hypothetical protein
MTIERSLFSVFASATALLLASGCAPGLSGGDGTGGKVGTGSGGAGTSATGGSTATTTGGSTGTSSGGATVSTTGGSTGTTTGGSTGTTSGGSTGTTGGTTGTATGGRVGTGGSGGSASGGRGGTTAGTGGRGGTTATGGATVMGSGGVAPAALDCGSMATVIENHGPPANRINYVIVGDGYSAAELTTTLIDNVKFAMVKRFSAEIGQPYLRYRNFINICALQIASTPICGSSKFGCCGNDTSRLANCNDSAVDAAIKQYIPATFMVDWRAVMLNGKSWWNSGGMLMYWSGGNSEADGAALHEGSHGFHQLADEYGDCTGKNCGSNTNFSGSTGQVYPEVNSCGNPMTTDGKWDAWKGYNASTSTGMVGTWSGSRYVGSGQYRPSANSMMNSLFGDTVDTSFNPVSREQMAVGMWRYVRPIDSVEPPAGAVTNPAMLKVNVIDPAVINVDWTVDGTVKVNGGITLDTSTLAAGSHTISAKAYDNAGMDLVRTKTCPSSVTGVYCHAKNWANSIQTVNWTVTKN